MPKRIFRRATRNLRTPAARYPADPRVIFILVACVLAGAGSLFGDATPGSVQNQLDHIWVVIWGVMLGLGALVTLVGTFKLDPNGVYLESVGCVAVCGASWLFAASVWGYAGRVGLFPGLVQFMFGVASLWRAFQLWSLVRNAVRIADGGDA